MNIDLAYIETLIHQAKHHTGPEIPLTKLLPLIDLTRLELDGDHGAIIDLCQAAETAQGLVAAVCVYPEFIPTVRDQVHESINIATVVNFPKGDEDLDKVLQDIDAAITAGAHEIDMVIPYRQYLAGDKECVYIWVRRAQEVCDGHAQLKAILETGALQSLEHIVAVSHQAIDAGADFIKTSTGKIATGATLEAVTAMLLATKQSGNTCGVKVSGGVRTVQQALEYAALAVLVKGKDALTPEQFRIGASSLLSELLTCIEE